MEELRLERQPRTAPQRLPGVEADAAPGIVAQARDRLGQLLVGRLVGVAGERVRQLADGEAVERGGAVLRRRGVLGEAARPQDGQGRRSSNQASSLHVGLTLPGPPPSAARV